MKGRPADFRIIGAITQIDVIAIRQRIRVLRRLRKMHGSGRWRKLKGIAPIQLEDGTIRIAELHWYEAHGIGKREIKVKRILE